MVSPVLMLRTSQSDSPDSQRVTRAMSRLVSRSAYMPLLSVGWLGLVTVGRSTLIFLDQLVEIVVLVRGSLAKCQDGDARSIVLDHVDHPPGIQPDAPQLC